GEARAVVQGPRIGGHGAEDEPYLFDARAVGGEHAARDRGAVSPLTRFRIAPEERAVVGEVGRERDVEEPALAARVQLTATREGSAESTPRATAVPCPP